MDEQAARAFGKNFHSRVRNAYSKTRTCYILNCSNSTINAHSITNNRLLRAISDNGEVIYMSTEQLDSNGKPEFTRTGRRKATAFPGFCDIHDKVFHLIDNSDYKLGNLEQEYLFALRASAKEFTTRQAINSHIDKLISDSLIAGEKNSTEGQFLLSKDGIESMKIFREGFTVGTKDLVAERHIFNVNLENKRYWKIKTIALVIDGEYPIVASSTFKLEEGLDGKVINDIPNLRSKAKPFYFTLFPQNGKTFCLLSWRNVDNSYYEHLNCLVDKDSHTKKVIASNLLCAYVENFAANPTYWDNIPVDTKKKYYEYFGMSSVAGSVPFIYDDTFSLFV